MSLDNMKCLNGCLIGYGGFYFSGPTDLGTIKGKYDACYYTCTGCKAIWLYGKDSCVTCGNTISKDTKIFLSRGQLAHLALIINNIILQDEYLRLIHETKKEL